LWICMEQRQTGCCETDGRSVQRETQNNELSVEYPHVLTKETPQS